MLLAMSSFVDYNIYFKDFIVYSKITKYFFYCSTHKNPCLARVFLEPQWVLLDWVVKQLLLSNALKKASEDITIRLFFIFLLIHPDLVNILKFTLTSLLYFG